MSVFKFRKLTSQVKKMPLVKFVDSKLYVVQCSVIDSEEKKSLRCSDSDQQEEILKHAFSQWGTG